MPFLILLAIFILALCLGAPVWALWLLGIITFGWLALIAVLMLFAAIATIAISTKRW